MVDNRTGVLRSNAQQNRDRILAVAHEAFAKNADASLNEIAQRAHVGAGTLYRHFPNREALILAVYQRDIEALVDSVPELLAVHEPLVALTTWYQTLARYIRVKHGLGEALNTAAAQELINETYAPVLSATTALIQACESAGVVREGLHASDVLLLMGFLWRVPATPEGQAQADRTLAVVVDGLRA